jgi:hypothetical protein
MGNVRLAADAQLTVVRFGAELIRAQNVLNVLRGQITLKESAQILDAGLGSGGG